MNAVFIGIKNAKKKEIITPKKQTNMGVNPLNFFILFN